MVARKFDVALAIVVCRNAIYCVRAVHHANIGKNSTGGQGRPPLHGAITDASSDSGAGMESRPYNLIANHQKKTLDKSDEINIYLGCVKETENLPIINHKLIIQGKERGKLKCAY